LSTDFSGMAINPLSSEARTLRSLKRLPLVNRLNEQLWVKILPHIEFTQLDEGDTLFSIGLVSEHLYMIMEGEIGLYLTVDKNEDPYFLQPRIRGETVGDFAVLNGGKHLVSGIAHRKTRLACFPAFAFELLVDIDPNILAHVYETAAALSRQVMLARVYVSLLGSIPTPKMNQLLEDTSTTHLEAGETLFLQGDEADGLHIVVSGRLNIESTDSDGNKIAIGEVSSNQCIGEFALLTESSRTASVYATRRSTIALLSRERFNAVILDDSAMIGSLTRIIVQRQMDRIGSNPIHNTPDENFVFIPLDSRLPLRRFIQQIKREILHEHNPLVVDANSFDIYYGKIGAAQTSYEDVFSSSVSAWLDEKENYHSHMVYVTDHSWTHWTRRCVNRADRIILIANAAQPADSRLRDIESKLESLYAETTFRPRIELVLLHPSDTAQPRGTKDWLDCRRLDAFHHVRLDDKLHVARLVRRMTGKANALVLSGGGARGFVHLGVQRAIEEESLAIDYISGASMGGLLGASMALGLDHAAVSQLCSRFASARALFDYTLPLTSLMKSRKLTEFCKAVYKDTQIEDLWVPFFCVSSNLTDGQEVLHDRGDLWHAVRATISLPGIFSPVPTADGGLLIDGAVLNTFPVSIMQDKLAGGCIIGVNVSQLNEVIESYDYGTSVSGWQLLWSRINPFSARIKTPRIAEVLLRSTDIKSVKRLHETRQKLDVLIEPDVSKIALLEFKSFARISDIGYAEAQAVLFKPKPESSSNQNQADSASTQNQRDGNKPSSSSELGNPVTN